MDRWYVLFMIVGVGVDEPVYEIIGMRGIAGAAVALADDRNRRPGLQGRYFVVGELEYESYWKEIVS